MPRLAIIHFLDGADGPVDPGFGVPGYGGGRPDNSLPGSPAHPGNALPPPGHIVTLPVYPFDPTRPDAGLPPSQPGVDNGLPSVRPGMKFIAKWVQCGGLILVPDNELPETPQPK